MSTPLRQRHPVFHEGEETVQRRAGVHDQAARLGEQMIAPVLEPDFQAFLAHLPVLYVAVSDPAGVWVSVLFGPPGFAVASSPDEVVITAQLAREDPLTSVLAKGPAPVGLLALEPMSRGRIRINGRATRSETGFTVQLTEAFGNCPKYIQRRYPVKLAAELTAGEPVVRHRAALTADERRLIEACDTFIIGSRHPDRGADASHRGGPPGFVAVSTDGSSLTFPDYHGNNMFQTLGNLTADPAAGLLFIDWESGRTLQLTGRAEVIWDADRISAWPRAERLVDVEIEEVIDRPRGLPLIWEFVEAHRLNPAGAGS